MNFPHQLLGGKRRLIVLGAGIFSLSFFVFLYIDIGANAMATLFPRDTLRAEFLRCFAAGVQGEVLRCMHERMPGWVERYGPASVVGELEYYGEHFGETTTCHAVGHIVGEALYEHVGDLSAIGYATNACHASVFHGVQGAFVEARGVEAFREEVIGRRLCDRWREDEQVYQLCTHGIGHALMVGAGYDYLEAAMACRGLEDAEHPDDVGAPLCVSGIFMELFDGTVGGHAAMEFHSDENDVFWPCTDGRLSNQDKAMCFSHIHSRLMRNTSYWEKGGVELCRKEAPAEWVRRCSWGAGYVNAAINIYRLDYTVTACRRTDSPDLRNACFIGALSWLRVGESAAQKTEEFCAKLSDKERATCQAPSSAHNNR